MVSNVTIENARLLFRNFAGKSGKFNREGERSFAVVIPPDVAQDMLRDGWNVKTLSAREEGDEDTYYVSVKVNYGGSGRPPKIVLVGAISNSRTLLSEDTVLEADWADIKTADVIIRPFQYDVNGKQGISAYLQSLYIVTNEDELDLKYGAGNGEGPGPRFED